MFVAFFYDFELTCLLFNFRNYFNPLIARIFTNFGLRGQSVTQGNMGTLLGVQDKKVNIPGQDISSLAAKGLKTKFYDK